MLTSHPPVPRVLRYSLFAFLWLACQCAQATVVATIITDRQALPIDIRVPQTPAWVTSRDGRHAVYELHITNFRDRALTLDRIEIRDDLNDASLLVLDSAALRSMVVRPGVASDAPELLDLGSGQTAVAFIDVRIAQDRPVPHLLSETLNFHENEQFSRLHSAPHVVGEVTRTLSAPLRGAGWLTATGLSNTSAHRRALLPLDGAARIAQRYAIDFIAVGDNGRLTRDDASSNESFFAYAAPVLAVAEGVVAAVRDGIPENRPLSEALAVKISPETFAGNFVILDVGGAWVVYSHLQPGSVRVKPGDRVKSGDELARVGNSGNSDAPHLQIQLVDRPAALAAEGLPFVFSKFIARGDVDDLDELLQPGHRWRADPQTQEMREQQLPLTGEVVDFPH